MQNNSTFLKSIAIGLMLSLLAACQTVTDYPATTAATRETKTVETAADWATRYEIRSELSDVRFLVFRAGALARLGHNHVVQAKNIRGEIRQSPDIHQSYFSIEIPVADLQVDSDSARQDEGEAFSSRPDAASIAGTARNMLGESVLDAPRYPTIEIHSTKLTGPAWGLDVGTRIKLHGVERELIVPTAVEQTGDTLVVTAFFSIAQTDFGITPMSLFGGALQVDNVIKVRMRIVAIRDPAPDAEPRRD